jgi:antitoxin (DNA-binding transcriptional repressor) of toxin-antitoxin stability system
MRRLSVRETRAALSRIEEILAREAEIIITRRRRPIARLTAMQPAAERPSHADLRAKMPQRTARAARPGGAGLIAGTKELRS